MKICGKIFRVLLVLWAGSLWSLAIWVAPILFFAQHDRSLAGYLAARMFGIEAYLAAGLCVAALIFPGRTRFGWLYAATASLAISVWGLKPVMTLARSQGAAFGLTFGAWHGVSALFYGLACIAALSLIWNHDFR